MSFSQQLLKQRQKRILQEHVLPRQFLLLATPSVARIWLVTVIANKVLAAFTLCIIPPGSQLPCFGPWVATAAAEMQEIRLKAQQHSVRQHRLQES